MTVCRDQADDRHATARATDLAICRLLVTGQDQRKVFFAAAHRASQRNDLAPGNCQVDRGSARRNLHVTGLQKWRGVCAGMILALAARRWAFGGSPGSREVMIT